MSSKRSKSFESHFRSTRTFRFPNRIESSAVGFVDTSSLYRSTSHRMVLRPGPIDTATLLTGPVCHLHDRGCLRSCYEPKGDSAPRSFRSRSRLLPAVQPVISTVVEKRYPLPTLVSAIAPVHVLIEVPAGSSVWFLYVEVVREPSWFYRSTQQPVAAPYKPPRIASWIVISILSRCPPFLPEGKG